MRAIRRAQQRPVSNREADAAAVRAVAQAAVNVELFTIPLYMVTLYSIQGAHQITAKGNDFYRDRLWPGSATTADPQTPNERAFNLIYSVFIEEMLHLQMAANLASAIGVTPIFTSPALQDRRHGWTCYGPDQTVIPHIIDLADTVHDGNVTVSLAALTAQQIALFLAIEEPAVHARGNIKKTARGEYFPSVPFEGWAVADTEVDLPMFGTIDHLYQCYYEYLTLEYADGTTLWQHVFTPGSQQKDMFNVEESPGHPKREYPGFSTTITAAGTGKALKQALDMINAITDQGEGSVLSLRLGDPEAVLEVKATYEATEGALEVDYPRYTDAGTLTESADTAARAENGHLDHYARFTQLTELLNQVETWPQWHQRHGPWTASDLQTQEITGDSHGQPSTQAVADAMNRVAAPGSRDTMHGLISQAAVGSLAGITTVLDLYWAQSDVVFPYPAMTGSADRMGTCWALFGAPPDLSLGLTDPSADVLYHGCQFLSLTKAGNGCAPIENYHSCRGSNRCQARGGCGFVHPAGGATAGAQCGFALVKAKDTGAPDGTFSAPSDNRCATMGGCAVPISAAQLLPQSGTMELVDFGPPHSVPEPFGSIEFTEGELVHDVAWRAYTAVMHHRGEAVPVHKPQPSDIRLVFPPST
jgi:Ferritin-like